MLKAPAKLSAIDEAQKEHLKSVSQSSCIRGRGHLVSEIQERLQKQYDFYEGDLQAYNRSPLKRIISKFELILSTHVRSMAESSIREYVKFIEGFTISNSQNVSPYLLIEMRVLKKGKKGDRPSSEASSKSNNQVGYKPSI